MRSVMPRMPAPLLAGFALPGLAVLTLFFLIPVGAGLTGAFGDGGAAFGRVFSDPVFRSALLGTLILGLSAPLISLIVGLFVALFLARLAPRMRSAALIAISLPLTFSGLIVAYGFILLLGRAGFVTQLLALVGFDPAVIGGFIFSPAGLGLAYSYYLVPRVVLIVLPGIRDFDAVQIRAARALGASPLRALVDVMLPQLAPALVSAFCLTSAVSVGAYGTALALSGSQVNILPILLYSRISEANTDLPAASAVSLLLVAICVGIILAGEALRARFGRHRGNG